MDDGVVVEERAGATWVVFNRPDRLNPFDAAALERLSEVAAATRAARPAAVVFTGRGRAFTTGGDLRWLAGLAESDGPALRAFFTRARDVVAEIERLPVPTIAAVNGICVAGGMELVCAVDLVVAAASARFADGHVNYGLLPVAGTSRRLAVRVGLSNAKRLLLTGEFIDAAEANRIGLVNWVVPDDELEPFVEGLCRELATKPAAALERLKRLTASALDGTGEDAAARELEEAVSHAGSDVVVEGLRAFRDRRAPRFG